MEERLSISLFDNMIRNHSTFEVNSLASKFNTGIRHQLCVIIQYYLEAFMQENLKNQPRLSGKYDKVD